MTDSSVDNSALYEAYKVYVLPWGETCVRSESRLSKLGKRPAWHDRATKLMKERGIGWHDAMIASHLEHSPEALENEPPPPISATDGDFIARCREGLLMKLPQRAGVEKELDWVGANAFRSLPDLGNVPSYFVLNFLIAARSNPKVLDNFWATCWSKRLSPGDVSKKSKSAVKEDVSDVESEGHDDDLRRRLFGDGE